MSLLFYVAPQSTASITELVLAELGTPHERVDVNLRGGDRAALLAVNPNNKVPVIVHDGTPIFESAAITLYLGEQFGTAQGLWPAAGPKRGEAMKWVVWANVTFADAIYRIGRNSGEWTPKDEQNEKALAAAKKDVGNLLAILDKHLADRAYLCGADYTLADTHCASFLGWPRHFMGVDFSAAPHVIAWMDRCEARPAFQRARGK